MPLGIFRAKGMVRLDLETDDYGILQVTGRAGSLKLVEPANAEAGRVTTELVFIGKPGATTNEGLKAHFEKVWEETNAPDAEGYLVTDLRAFTIIFA